jgi:hypothetical protein
MWEEAGPSGANDIFYKRAGADLDPSTDNLSSDTAGSLVPVVATRGNNVYVVWQDLELGIPEIFYMRSTDRGGTFGPIMNLSDNSGFSGVPDIAVAGDTVHVVWQDTTDDPAGDIFYRRSTDGGLLLRNR